MHQVEIAYLISCICVCIIKDSAIRAHLFTFHASLLIFLPLIFFNSIDLTVKI